MKFGNAYVFKPKYFHANMQSVHTYEQNLEDKFRIVLHSDIDSEDFSNSKLVVLCGPISAPYNLKPIAKYTFDHGTIISGYCEKNSLAVALLPFYLNKEIPDLVHSLTRRLLTDLGGYTKSRDKKKEIISGEDISLCFEFSDDQLDASVSAHSKNEVLFEYIARREDNKITYNKGFDLKTLISVLETVCDNNSYPIQMRLSARDLMCGLLPETQKELETIIFRQQQEAIVKADEAYWTAQDEAEKSENEK